MTKEEQKTILTAIRTTITMCEVSREAKTEANVAVSKALVKTIRTGDWIENDKNKNN